MTYMFILKCALKLVEEIILVNVKIPSVNGKIVVFKRQ